MRPIYLFSLLVLLSVGSIAQNYGDFASQSNRIKVLAQSYPSLATVSSLVKTNGGKDIWLLTIGTGKTSSKPAIAVIGGTEGNHLLGTEMAIGFAENLLQQSNTDSIKERLAKTTYYIFPNMSPDAMEQYFSKLRYERNGNASPTDDDRDGKLNEDGYEDLDGNGKITMMRVSSPIGDYKLNPDDPRLLVKADIAKGEKGAYLLLEEGMDNDKDGKCNEDGEGGIAFNKNLTYKHNTFGAGAGEFPASEKETRALLDFLYDAFNVYAVISFGSNNNLSTPVPFNPIAARERILAGYLEPDAKVNSMVSDLYNKITGTKDAPKSNVTAGDVLSWGYFHYARFSFSTPGWWIPKTKPDSTKKEKAFTIEDPAASYLRWAEHQGIPNTFTDWKEIKHPDFPDQKTEVGGLDPFVLTNPPFKMVAEISKKHTDFILKLSEKQPEIAIADVKTEKLANGLTRVSLKVINKGGLATHSKLGERSYFLKKLKVALTTDKQQIVGGRKVTLLSSLAASGEESFSWLIKGSGKLVIEVGCPTAGMKNLDITL